MHYNYVADGFHTKKFVADFFKKSKLFQWKTAILRILSSPPPGEGLGPRTLFIFGSLESLYVTSY